MTQKSRFTVYFSLALFVLIWQPGMGQVNWTQMEDPILDVGPPGSWESEAVLHPVVLYFDSTYHMWYSGRDDSNRVRIGYATSADGLSWNRYVNNPVLDIGEPGTWDDNIVTGPVVVKAGNKFHLWYWGISVNGNIGSAVGHAVSPDGINWIKDPKNPVILPGGPGEWDYTWTATGGVLYEAPYFRMWYSAVGNPDLSDAGIGLAISRDGTNWKKHPANPLMQGAGPPAWDNTFVYNPSIIKDKHIYHMWFHGAWPFQIGYATSLNGLDWQKHQSNPLVTNGPAGAWDETGRLVPTVVRKDNHYQMWHTGIDGAIDTFKIGYASAPVATAEPVIVSVSDIPDDQGKQVRVTWNASIFDGIYRHKQVETYSIWRQVDETAKTIPGSVPVDLEEARLSAGTAFYKGTYWDFVAAVPPHQFSKYGYVASTLKDITNGDTTWTEFMVSAHSKKPGEYWNSLPVSGYSVDNIAPPAPSNLLAKNVNDGDVSLSWSPSKAADFSHFVLYRDNHSGFSPSISNSLTSTIETGFSDIVIQSGQNQYYRVAAYDSAGNQSDFSEELEFKVSDQDNDLALIQQFELAQNFPNPFNPTTEISFKVPVTTHLKMTIYNLLGEEIVSLIDESIPPGQHTVSWDGRDGQGQRVESGVYIYRLEADKWSASRKMVYLK